MVGSGLALVVHRRRRGVREGLVDVVGLAHELELELGHLAEPVVDLLEPDRRRLGGDDVGAEDQLDAGVVGLGPHDAVESVDLLSVVLEEVQDRVGDLASGVPHLDARGSVQPGGFTSSLYLGSFQCSSFP